MTKISIFQELALALGSVRSRAALGLGIVACVASAQAAEGGVSNYPYGALTSYSALMPTPGATQFYGYVVSYPASRINDGAGKPVEGANSELFAAAPRVVHSWAESFAGFTLSSGGVIEGLHAHVAVPGRQDAVTGPTLIGIEPLYLSRAIGTLHLWTGGVVYLPFGTFDPSRLVNSTASFTSYAYQFAATWIPTSRWDLSLAFAAEFKERNKHTDYRSGTQAGVTYGFSYRPFGDTRWQLGVTGFYTDQLGDDEIGGVAVAAGGRTRKWAVGPKVAYWFGPAGAVIFQWHHEYAARNAPQGDLYWFQFGFPLY